VTEPVGGVLERGAEGGVRSVDERLAERRGHGSGAPGGGVRIGHLVSVSWLVQLGHRVAVSEISVTQ
jgi:hypothetical protein